MIDTIDRRAFFGGLFALAAAERLQAVTPARRTMAHDPFQLGMASGEPAADGVVLWTRLTGPDAGMLAADAVEVRWEVAEDEAFRRVTKAGRFVTGPEVAHAVHVEVAGLAPGRSHFYRFHALGVTSPVGRAITLPLVADRLRLALTACQHWEQGWFSAYRDIIAAEPDLIVQVGDYVYEHGFGTGPTVRRFPFAEPETLGAYRALHALYKTDRDLQAAHRAHTWLVTWDDHEVANDYAGLTNPLELDPVAFLKRRTAAYQAYFEHMPIRPSRWRSAVDPRLYYRLRWGGLASILVLDGRSARSAHPCSGPGRRGGRSLAQCDALADPERSMLGGVQEAWLYDTLAQEDCGWTLIAQQTLFAPMIRAPKGEPEIWTDGWDGYPRARERLIAALRSPKVRNPVILSGDLHCAFVCDVPAPDNPKQPVATEFLTTCLASRTQGDTPFGDVLARNPHIRFKDTGNSGYMLLDVGTRGLTAEHRVVRDQLQPDSPVTVAARFAVSAGRAGAEQI